MVPTKSTTLPGTLRATHLEDFPGPNPIPIRGLGDHVSLQRGDWEGTAVEGGGELKAQLVCFLSNPRSARCSTCYGQISFSPSSGLRSTMGFCLSLARNRKAGAMEDKSSQPKTVLVADDEESIRKFVSGVLADHGYNLLVASSGENALEQSKEYKGTIHLLLSNLQMPGITGLELGTQLQLERPELRVMLMSGFSSGMLILNEGWHFLHKPFIPSQLLALTKNVLAAPFPEIPCLDEHKQDPERGA
ncbi:MAG TPA: response regulator [Bryobacteraceae bacterium]|nr:response regulator [Bryobacteraceae bacterium]